MRPTNCVSDYTPPAGGGSPSFRREDEAAFCALQKHAWREMIHASARTHIGQMMRFMIRVILGLVFFSPPSLSFFFVLFYIGDLILWHVGIFPPASYYAVSFNSDNLTMPVSVHFRYFPFPLRQGIRFPRGNDRGELEERAWMLVGETGTFPALLFSTTLMLKLVLRRVLFLRKVDRRLCNRLCYFSCCSFHSEIYYARRRENYIFFSH